MPKQYPYKLVIKVLKKHGFVFVSQRGSHVKFRKEGNPSLVTIIPIGKKEIPYGTFRAILMQAKLSEGDFIV